jgi:hypothetical protein
MGSGRYTIHCTSTLAEFNKHKQNLKHGLFFDPICAARPDHSGIVSQSSELRYTANTQLEHRKSLQLLRYGHSHIVVQSTPGIPELVGYTHFTRAPSSG